MAGIHQCVRQVSVPGIFIPSMAQPTQEQLLFPYLKFYCGNRLFHLAGNLVLWQPTVRAMRAAELP
jgi:hypothetical protein